MYMYIYVHDHVSSFELYLIPFEFADKFQPNLKRTVISQRC